MAITKVYLLNVPLENDYKNTLYFKSKDAQTEYFRSKIVHKSEDFSYQRKEQYIRYPKMYDELLNCNYVMYQNTEYNNKWFYAFITNIEYIDTENSKIFIETDCIQTWLFDYVVKDSFIEREHVSDDTIGIHTVPEQLETGDYTVNNKIKNKSLNYRGFLVGATVDLTDKTARADSSKSTQFPNVSGGLYNGVYSGIKYFYFALASEINTILNLVATKGQSAAIVCIFAIPSQYVEVEQGENAVGLVAKATETVKSYNWNPGILGLEQESILKPTNINGYIPKNNKLFTYPFCYCLMSNNAGGGAVYKYELFKNTSDADLCDFKINFALTPGGSVRLIPLYYNGADENNDEGLNGPKFPICNWNTDVYTNWLTQNAVNIPLQIVSSAVTIAGGVGMAMTGAGAMAGAGAVVGGVLGIASTVGEIYAHSLQPPQSEGNINSGDVTFSNGDTTFTAYQMSVKKEYAQIIDNFFTMFGYKVNRVKKPNTNHRSRFWYTKTIDVNIDGPIPNKDIQIIKDCYNRGVTFWRDANDVNNYTDDNLIL